MRDIPNPVPGPRAHHRGTVALVRSLAAVAGGSPDEALDLMGAGSHLPEEVAPERRTVKYDAYLSEGPTGCAWGVTVGDRWEEAEFPRRAAVWLEARGYPWAEVAVLAGAIGQSACTLGLGYDRPGATARVKVYLQEERWGAGRTTVAQVAAALGRLGGGLEVPAWVPRTQAVGVVTVDLGVGRTLGVKVYLGGESPGALRGAPAPVQALLARFEATRRVDDGWFYLTLRLRPGAPVRYSANRIYPHVARFADGEGWVDVEALFTSVGRAAALDRVRSVVERPGLRVVPTASALDEDGGVDLYCAAWAVG